MKYPHQIARIQLSKLSISLLIVFMCFFIASCNKKTFSEPQKKTTQIHPSLPKGFELIEEINPTSQKATKVIKLEKGVMYTIRLVKSKENRSKVLLYNGDKKIVSSFTRGRYYSGVNYLCKKTDEYTFVIETDPKQEAPKIIFASKKS